MDYFDQLPDHVLLDILDLIVSDDDDINALFRLRTLSHRFNLLVTMKTKHLFLQVDKLDELFHTCLESCYSRSSPLLASKTMLVLICPKLRKKPTMFSIMDDVNRRACLLRCFNHVTKLVIELPEGDCMPPSPMHRVRCLYKATFGKNLNSCVIILYSLQEYCERKQQFMRRKIEEICGFSKKCAYSLALKVLPHLENLVSMVVEGGGGDFEMVMDKEGIRECREVYNKKINLLRVSARVCYRIRANQDRCIDIGGGLGQGNMVLAVVAGPCCEERIDDVEEADLARRAFGSGVHGTALKKLLHSSNFVDSSSYFY